MINGTMLFRKHSLNKISRPIRPFPSWKGWYSTPFSNTFTSIGVTSVGFSDNATRRRQTAIALTGRDFLNGIFAVVMDGQTWCARKSSKAKISVPQLQVFYRTHRVNRPFDPVFYSLVFYIIYI